METNNTNTETVVEAAPVAAEPAKKATPVIVARKVMKGKCNHKPGAPLKPIIGLTSHRPRGCFTKKHIFDLNGQTVSELCIDQRLKRLIKAKELFKMASAVKNDGPGRPPVRYTFDATKAEMKSKKTSKAEPVAVAEPVETVPAEAVVAAEEPAV